jgi:hypothetical protein
MLAAEIPRIKKNPAIEPGAQKDTQIDRYELKYVVDPNIVPAIRDFIQPFVNRDSNGIGDIPEYIVTTLQLDSTNAALHYAKERKAYSRFKLRIRTYGTDGECPYFLEIKRKVNTMILKSRAILQPSDYSRENIVRPTTLIPFNTESESLNYLEFVRLVNEIGARPTIFIRYIRESYKGTSESYSRVTLDRAITYRPAKGSWGFPHQEKRWYTLDTQASLRREFPGYILELKSGAELPCWMAELIERFNLVRTGFCKYSAAMRLESIFTGRQYSVSSENCTYEDGSDY